MNSFLAQRVRKTTMTIMIWKKIPKKEEFWIKALKMTEIVNENRLIVWTEVRFLYHLMLFSFAEITTKYPPPTLIFLVCIKNYSNQDLRITSLS